jgi:hypothetical protein
LANPEKRKALAQLGVSERLSAASRAAGMVGVTELNEFLSENISSRLLRQQPAAFAGAILGAIAETAMEFMARDPQHAAQYRQAGFEAFWSALGAK